MIPHLENEVFIMTSYPDGTAARTDVRVSVSGAHEQYVSTDSRWSCGDPRQSGFRLGINSRRRGRSPGEPHFERCSSSDATRRRPGSTAYFPNRVEGG